MGHVELAGIGYRLPDGRGLLRDVGFRVGDGDKVALVGANGAGKTTLLRIIAGDLAPHEGSVVRSGGLGIMNQFVGTGRGVATVRDLLVSVAPPAIRAAAAALDRAEIRLEEKDDERSQLAYASALAGWSEAGGYDIEVLWDVCCFEAVGQAYDRIQGRDVMTLSGGEQKRLVLQALLRGDEDVLVLDEPDNYLDVPSKRWLEDRLRGTPKTVLYVSHDRELLARTANRVVTLEGSSNVADGSTTWVHGGGFESYHRARLDRHARFDELHKRWADDRARLEALVKALQLAKSPKTEAAKSRLRRHEAAEPPEPPRGQQIRMRLAGGRTGVRALICERLELTGLTEPFDLEVFYGERLAVLGSNGTGKSHFLRLLAGWTGTDTAGAGTAAAGTAAAGAAGAGTDGAGTAAAGAATVAHAGAWKLGARVVPGHFSQTHEHPELTGRDLLTILWEDCSLRMEQAARALHRYELTAAREQRFETLSGGQQARFQILLLELSGATMLILDEPTDNLDVDSAEALEAALDDFDGTVVAVTHDRWFARSFDRFVVFSDDGTVAEVAEPSWIQAYA